MAASRSHLRGTSIVNTERSFMASIILIEYQELSYGSNEAVDFPALRDSVCSEPQEHENEIARYLEMAPSYAGMGAVVGDVLDPAAKVVLFPGGKTDGVFA